MREREKIESDLLEEHQRAQNSGWARINYDEYIIEVLLDIRDILNKQR